MPERPSAGGRASRIRRSTCRFLASLLAFAVVPASAVRAEGDAEADLYRTPPAPLADVLAAPLTPAAKVDPAGRWLLLMERPSLPPISELAERELRLAGRRINPRLDGPSRERYVRGLRLVPIEGGEEPAIRGLPAELRLDDAVFSPDGSHLAFTHAAEAGIELWLLEVASGRARRLTDARLSLSLGAAPAWLPDGRSLALLLVPEGRGPEPPAPRVPRGPVVRESLGKVAPAPTFQDLLASPHDEALFEHYMTSRLAIVGLDGSVERLGEPAIFQRFDPSPDGRYLLVEILERPFSYLVPARRFPGHIEVWDRQGRQVQRLAKLPLREEIPIAFGSVATGPRDVAWRDDEPATLVWVEALDGGDAGVEAAERDRLFELPAPFDGRPEPLATFALRYGGVSWGDDGVALASTWWWQSRRLRTWRLRPGQDRSAGVLVFDRSFEDRYADPGDPQSHVDAAGRRRLLLAADGDVFLIGEGASPEGDRPFLDRLDLESGESERLFHSEPPYYEEPIAVLDAAGRRLLTRRESREEPPNFFLRDLETGEVRRLTDLPHPTPQLAGVQKELIRYRRADGVDLTATLYLPAGYDAERDGPLPLLVWAYPRELKSADVAGQVKGSPHRFDRVTWSSALVWVTRGYAVLDDPSMPIIGEGEAEPNDTYVEQLVASAEAAVEEMVRRGVAERGRIAIGGHSYGAFMTANLLAHSDLFAAGIARSGAYNRSLTPFGFQAEERTLWQAPEVYFRMSPFMHADEVDEPILLIHGQADNNSGTYPMQSERFYNALKGLGATVRLVMLPHESHSYRARESVFHMLWEIDRWLETYVKRAEAAEPGA